MSTFVLPSMLILLVLLRVVVGNFKIDNNNVRLLEAAMSFLKARGM
jgi:hypothetical protein